MLNIVLVNYRNYLGRGQEYVDRLAHGINRNLQSRYKMHVITDADVPDGIDGWWAKLVMFQPGRFKGRCLYLDLDTVITGSLEDLAGYRGEFAMIRDFYHAHLLQSGVMAWDADKAGDIWERWEKAEKPQFHPTGDGGWIHYMRQKADVLQDLYPGQIVSFKAQCAQGVPEGAKVVCFHGLPRPHTLSDLMRNW